MEAGIISEERQPVRAARILKKKRTRGFAAPMLPDQIKVRIFKNVAQWGFAAPMLPEHFPLSFLESSTATQKRVPVCSTEGRPSNARRKNGARAQRFFQRRETSRQRPSPAGLLPQPRWATAPAPLGCCPSPSYAAALARRSKTRARRQLGGSASHPRMCVCLIFPSKKSWGFARNTNCR